MVIISYTLKNKSVIKNIDDFTVAYLESMLSHVYQDGTCCYMYSIYDIDHKSLDKAIKDCKRFQENNSHFLICSTYEDGRSFWLCRNGQDSFNNYPSHLKSSFVDECNRLPKLILKEEKGVVFISEIEKN